MRKIRDILDDGRGYKLLVLLLILSLFQYAVRKIYVFFLYPDEFGYWSSAATVLGWNWQEIAGLGSFYSFGYSVILLPILWLIEDSVVAYRLAIAVNMLLMCNGFFLLKKICRKLLGEEKGTKHILFAAVAVFFPTWIVYMQITATEALSMYLFVLASWLSFRLFDKASVSTGVALVCVLGYAYMVHLRLIGVLIAWVMTVGMWGLCRSANRKRILLLLGAIVAVALIALFFKEIVRETVYSGVTDEVLNYNDLGGQFHKLQFLLSPEGMGQFVINVSGKVLYMGTASLGLFYFGIDWCIRRVIDVIRCLKSSTPVIAQSFWGVYLLLAALAEIMIASLYSIRNTELDWIVYGRYSEFILPVFMVLGLCHLHEICVLRRLPEAGMVAWFVHSLVSAIGFSAFVGDKPEKIRGYMSVGIGFLAGKEDVDPGVFFAKIWILGSIFILLLLLCLFWIRKDESLTWILSVILALEILIGLHSSHLHIYPVSEYMRYDLYMGESIMEDMDPETEIMYLKEDRTQWIDMIQMQLRERTIHVVEHEQLAERAKGNTAVIVHKDGEFREEAEMLYGHCREYNVFCLYYN